MPVPKKPRVLIVSRYFPPSFLGGGPPRSLEALTYLVGEDVDFKVIACGYDIDRRPLPNVVPDRWTPFPKQTQVWYTASWNPTLRSWLGLFREVDADIVYINSFFESRFAFLPLLALRILRPSTELLVAPRGVLMDGAFSRHTFKKKHYLRALRTLSLIDSHTHWHACNEIERSSVAKHIGPKAKVFVVSNLRIPQVSEMGVRHDKDSDSLRVVFLSRIDRQKNLLGAVHALQLQNESVEFTIAGPMEQQDYWAEVAEAVEQLPNNVRTTVLGPIEPGQIHDMLSKHDVLLLPTFGENYGHVIAEALSAGLPVIIGPETPWSAHQAVCGAIRICDPNDIRSIANALEEVQSMGAEERLTIREAALNLANDERAQERDVESYLEMFSSIRGIDIV